MDYLASMSGEPDEYLDHTDGSRWQRCELRVMRMRPIYVICAVLIMVGLAWYARISRPTINATSSQTLTKSVTTMIQRNHGRLQGTLAVALSTAILMDSVGEVTAGSSKELALSVYQGCDMFQFIRAVRTNRPRAIAAIDTHLALKAHEAGTLNLIDEKLVGIRSILQSEAVVSALALE